MSSIKILLGVAGFSSVLGGAFAINKILDSEEDIQEKKQKYFIGSIVDKTTNIPQTGLINEQNKNYFCKSGKNLIKNCNIYKLNSSSNVDIPLDALSISNNEKIVISFPENEQAKIKEGQKIAIHETNKEKSLIFNINIDNLNDQKNNIFPAQTIIAKIKRVNESVKENYESTFKCSVDAKDTEIDCQVYKLTNENHLNSERKNQFFKDAEIDTKVEFKEDVKKNDYVMIKTNDTTLKTSNWNSKDLKIYVNNTPRDKNFDEFLEIEYVATIIFSNIPVPHVKMDYVIASAETIANNGSSTPAFSENGYVCMIPISENLSISDNSCTVHKIGQNDSSNAKTINFNGIFKNSDDQKIKTVLTANEKYVLRINKKKFAKLNTGGKITLVNDVNKEIKYFDLNKTQKLTNENHQLKTNILLVKVKEPDSTSGLGTDNNNYKCKFTSTQKNRQSCTVYSFSNSQTPSDSNEITFAQMQKLTETNKTNAAKDKYLIIEINGENNMFTEKELRSFIPEIYAVPLSASAESSTALLKTEYVYSYIGYINSTTFSSSDLLRIKPSAQDYLLVEHHSTSANQSNDELTQNGNTKNYICRFGSGDNELVDDTCELKIINDPTANKAIQHSAITNPSSTAIKKTNFTTGKFFKLIVNNPKMLHAANQGLNITIASNQSNEVNNYGEVKIISKSFDEIRSIKTSLYLVKSKASISLGQEVLTTQKCKLSNEDNFNLCSIYSFATDPHPTDKSNLDFSQASIKINNSSNITAEKYFVVKFTQGNHEVLNIDAQGQEINLSVENKEITNFDIIAPIYAKNDTHTTGPVVFLK